MAFKYHEIARHGGKVEDLLYITRSANSRDNQGRGHLVAKEQESWQPAGAHRYAARWKVAEGLRWQMLVVWIESQNVRR